VSGSYSASGVYGENTAGGYGVAGRTYGFLNEGRAAVLGESLRDPSTPAGGPNGKAAGVYGYSENGYGGVFITGQAGSDVPWVNSGALRVVGDIVKTFGEYSEALPHPDGSQRLMYAPLSPESWYEDYGRSQLVEGRAEVELDPDFVNLLVLTTVAITCSLHRRVIHAGYTSATETPGHSRYGSNRMEPAMLGSATEL
jgi:hypothetical protein